MSEEYHYTGRLWVLPFSREYNFISDDGNVEIGGRATIHPNCFTTTQLEKLTPGGRYMCEFDRDPVNGFCPVLLYIRTENGEPITGAQLDLPLRVAKLEAQVAVLESDKKKTEEASKKMLATLKKVRSR